MDDYVIDGDLVFSNKSSALKFYREQYHKKKEWQGLTENEKELLWDEAVDGKEHFCSQYGDFADAIEAKLKEKNT